MARTQEPRGLRVRAARGGRVVGVTAAARVVSTRRSRKDPLQGCWEAFRGTGRRSSSAGFGTGYARC